MVGNKIGAIALVSAVAMSVAACSSGSVTKQDAGVVGGALLGGLVGNQFGQGGGRVAATVGGALVGGLIGGVIGSSLDESDRRQAEEAEYRALQGTSSAPVQWRSQSNPNRYGTVSAGPTYQASNGACRQYTHTIYVDGTPQTARGTACRNPDGSWTPTA